MHRKMRCAARAAVEAEEVAQAAKAAEGLYLLPRRAYRHQMFGERHNRMCCEGWCPLAAVSVQDMLPHRPLLRTFAQVFRVRDVASFDVGQLFKPPKNTQDQAPTKASAVKVGFRRRSEPARHAAAPTTCFELLLNWSLSSFPTPRRDNPASSGVCHLRQRVPWLGWSSNPRTLP